LTSDEDGGLRLWAADGALLARLPDDGIGFGFDVEAGRALVAGAQPRLRVWDLRAATEVAPIDGHLGRIRRAAYGPDGATVYTASSDGTARVVDAATGLTRLVLGTAPPIPDPPWAPGQPPPRTPHGVRWIDRGPDGTSLVTAGEDGVITVWDAGRGVATSRLTGHAGGVVHARFDATGARVISAGLDGTARIWDLATGAATCITTPLDGAPLWDAVASPDGRWLVVQHSQVDPDGHGDPITVWDVARCARVDAGELRVNRMASLPMTADGTVAVAHYDGVRVYDLTTRALLRTFNEQLVVSYATTPDGRVAVTGAPGRIAVFDGTSGALRRGWSLDGPDAALVALRADGALVAAATGDRVQLWDVAGGALLAEMPRFPSRVNQLGFSPDGATLLVAGLAGHVWQWRLPSYAGDGAALTALAACASPLALEGSVLTAVNVPRSCAP
ncbi:MAG: hypothetical protein R2939_14760, partial [Kofleriaceae bacterium]